VKERPSRRLQSVVVVPSPAAESIAERHLIPLKCGDEKQQADLQDRFGREGLECKALLM
jgi:hypothetical protein